MMIEKYFEILRKTPTGNICDAMRRIGVSGYCKGLMCLQGKPAENMVGPAVTVQYAPKQAGYNCKLPRQFQVVYEAAPGSVIVWAACGTECWLTGGNVSRMAQLKGVNGMIIDGCCRDKEEIARHSMPVYCKGSGTKPYAEELMMTGYNVPVNACGTWINPGDILVGDDDGVVVIPVIFLDKVMAQLADIADIEEKLAAAIEQKASLEECAAIGDRKAKVVQYC